MNKYVLSERKNNKTSHILLTGVFSILYALIIVFQRMNTPFSIFSIWEYSFSTSDFFMMLSAGIGGYWCGLLSFAAVFIFELVTRGNYAEMFSLAVYLFTVVLQGYFTHKCWYKSKKKTAVAALIFTLFLGSSWYIIAFYLSRTGFAIYQDIPLLKQFIGALPEAVLSQTVIYLFFKFAPDRLKNKIVMGYRYTRTYDEQARVENTRDISALGSRVTLLVLAEAVILGACAAIFGGLQFGAETERSQLISSLRYNK